MVDASLIKRISTSLAAHQSALGSAKELLGATLDLSDAPSGAIYLLSLTDGCYEPICSAGASDVADIWPTVCSEAFPPRHEGSPITTGIPSSRFFASAREGAAVLAFRKSTCLGALVLEDIHWDGISDVVKLALESTAALLVPVFHRRFTSELLDSLQSPLDFRKSEPEFYEDVGELIGLSAGMEFSAIRELEEDGSLTCLGFWDHGRESKSSSLDIKNPASLSPFLQATEGHTAAVSDVAEVPEMRQFLREADLDSVRSFVAIPIRVGVDVFGVLSVAARCAFDYTDIELAGFESIANGIGVAITNYRYFHEATGRIHEMAKAGFAITSLEVATAARHEALNHLHEAQSELLKAYKVISGTPLHYVEEASEKVKEAGLALNKIKVVVDPPKKVLERLALGEVFEEARAEVSGRLHKERINCNPPAGGRVEVMGHRPYLRTAFENLLLNSIDALQEGKRRGRLIEFAISTPSPRDTHVRATFRDNGPGIQLPRLKDAQGAAHASDVGSIFLPGVTSKDSGTGFGLWLVRKIITEQGGSIDLRDFRQGVVFDLKFKRN
jgi:signal transduction histidine kinase